MKRKLKENKKKGFTLVELIVVLVILAILAALLIPALTGYIDKAKEKQIISETRSCVMAAQTIADEQYAKGNKDIDQDDQVGANNTDTAGQAVLELADVATSATVKFTVTGGKVTELTYENAGKICTYDEDATGDKYVVSDTP